MQCVRSAVFWSLMLFVLCSDEVDDYEDVDDAVDDEAVDEAFDDVDDEQQDPEGNNLQRQVDFLKRNYISSTSREAYVGRIVQQLIWYHENLPNVVRIYPAVDEEISLKDLKNAVKDFVIAGIDAKEPCPIDETVFTADDLLKFLVSLQSKRADGGISNSTYTMHRSALYHLYREHGLKFSETMESGLKLSFRGTSDPGRSTALRTARPGRPRRRPEPLFSARRQHAARVFGSCLSFDAASLRGLQPLPRQAHGLMQLLHQLFPG